MGQATNSNTSVLLHPYFPQTLALPTYVANEFPLSTLLTSFAVTATIILWFASIFARTIRPKLSKTDLWTTQWFMLCGFIHLFFEGYFAFNNADMPSRTHLFGQLWKEYALSDRRYLTRDSFVVCMETVTAVCWGPLSFVIAWLTARDHPLRHGLQLLVSMGQLYGDVLYYATFFFDERTVGAVYCRPENYYYWAYFVTMNGFWIVIPLCLVGQSLVATTRAARVAQAAGQRK